MATLYLVPVTLSDTNPSSVLPAANIAVVKEIKHFIVENERTARRFLKKCDRTIDIDALNLAVLNEHTPAEELPSLLNPLFSGDDMCVMSEAGCPGIADPGAEVVAIAQSKGHTVKPLVGPSSILLGLMASGFNGQSFAFIGYLPHDKGERERKFKEMERRISKERQTQIFIETPYRNDRLLAEMCQTLPQHLKLCVATDVTGENERIHTRTIAQWRKELPEIGKVPTIFLLYV